MKSKKQSGMGGGKLIAIGAGVAAIAAGSYYFFGPDGKKHQKGAKNWMMDMKKVVVKKIQASKNMSESVYHNIIDSVVTGYLSKNKGNEKEVRMFAEGLKKQWKHILSQAGGKAKKKVAGKKTSAKKMVKKVIKKATKKVAKKK
jgi:hypothetical protein